MNIIDSNLNSPIATQGSQAKYDQLVNEAAKAQDEARTAVNDASDRVPQFQAIGVDLADPNSSLKAKIDRKTNPAQGFHKQPDMPKPADLKAIKVNY